MEGSNRKVSPRQVSERLRQGINRLDDDLLEAIKAILPIGEYLVCLFNVLPELVKPGEKNDYFCHEQVETWGIDQFWGLPHSPKTEYYRTLSVRLKRTERLFEFIVPLYPGIWLEQETVAKYQEAFQSKSRPTALAISILDVREPAVPQPGATNAYRHWDFVHYLLDGHHKTWAAAKDNRPLSLLSCIPLAARISSANRIRRVLDVLAGQSI